MLLDFIVHQELRQSKTIKALIIAKVIDVSKAESPSEMTLFEYRSKVQEQISQEIMAQYLDYLKGKYNVTVYSK